MEIEQHQENKYTQINTENQSQTMKLYRKVPLIKFYTSQEDRVNV